jgi:flagellar protein FliO/FliZ
VSRATSFFPRTLLALLLLGLAVPAFAQAPDDIVRPRAAPAVDAPAVGRPESRTNSTLLVFGLAAAAVGGWLIWQQRRSPRGIAGREARKLAIAETRSLGNRQFLVVADYDGRKFLLGVCPGRIELLVPLNDDAPRAKTP